MFHFLSDFVLTTAGNTHRQQSCTARFLIIYVTLQASTPPPPSPLLAPFSSTTFIPQVAWRERQKNRFMEAPRLSTVGGASASPLSAHPPSPARSIPSLPSNLALNSHNGPEPMDDGSNDFMSGNNNSVAGDVSGGESPPRGSIANGSDADGGRGGRGGGGGGGGGGSVSLNLTGADGEQSTREERAAKALQTAARVMLARRGRFQRLARETSALLVIQKRSREWLNKK